MSHPLSDRRRKYMTIKEVAEYFSVARTTIYQAVSEGKLKCIRIGKRAIRIHVDEVKRYEEAAADNWHGLG